MSNIKPEVFVLCRSKRYTVCWSAYITRELVKLGVAAYRVTPNAVPRFSPTRVKLVINYGCSTTPIWWDRLPDDCVVLNTPEQVSVSVNKVAMMQAFTELCPAHTVDYCLTKGEAQSFIDAGETIVARTLTRSHSGKGIVLSPPSPLPDAKLYTVLKRRRGLREYRVFMYDGKLIDVVQKRRKTKAKLVEGGYCTAAEAETWWDSRERQVIRCWDNGWSFCHNDLDVDDPVVFNEIAEVTSNLIPWGCVDVLIDTRTKEWYMIEINSAPGLDAGNTQRTFINAFLSSANALGILATTEVAANFKEV